MFRIWNQIKTLDKRIKCLNCCSLFISKEKRSWFLWCPVPRLRQPTKQAFNDDDDVEDDDYDGDDDGGADDGDEENDDDGDDDNGEEDDETDGGDGDGDDDDIHAIKYHTGGLKVGWGRMPKAQQQ